MIEQFSVAESSTPGLTFAEDLAVYVSAEVGGIGICESKLGQGSDAQTLADFLTSGLRATLAVPRVPSVFPSLPSDKPLDPAARIDMIRASVRRLAAFDPVAIGIHGGPVGGRTPLEARAVIVHALRTLARTAATLHPRGFQIALEPVAPEWSHRGWAVTSLAEAADLIDEAAAPNLKIVLDVWHLADVPVQEIERFIDRIALVQIADRPARGPSRTDRVLPGDGVIDFSGLVGTLTRAGYRGWYELDLWPQDADAEAGGHQPTREQGAGTLVARARRHFRDISRDLPGIPAA
jgi:sugar phosphate isomerase/epimerase